MKKKIFLFFLTVIMTIGMSVTSSAAGTELLLICDDADLLSDYEETLLQSRLEKLSDSAEMDTVIVTVDSVGFQSPEEFADDFFDFNGYGRGEKRDGLLLLVSMEESDWWISTRGYAAKVFTDAGLDYIGEQIVPYMSDGDFAAAFEEFAAQCDIFVQQANAGDPFDTHNLPKEPFEVGLSLIIALAIGLIIALLYTGSLKAQLQTVRRQSGASVYVKNDSLKIENARDIYLYRNVRKTVRQTSNSSSGGSRMHTSSSGASHGGRGGKF